MLGITIDQLRKQTLITLLTSYLLKYNITLISLNCTKTMPIIDVGKIISALSLPCSCDALAMIFTSAERYTFYYEIQTDT